MTDTYTIAQLAREFEITTRTIRFYEDQHLVSPGRNGRSRVYTARDRARLKLVLRGKRLGFSLQEIAEIIDLYDAEPGESDQRDFFLTRIAEHKAVLERQKADITRTLHELSAIEKQYRERRDSVVDT